MPYLAVDDPDGLHQESARARDMGFGGKAAIHPAQLAVIHQAFTPIVLERLNRLKLILAAYADAPGGVVVLMSSVESR